MGQEEWARIERILDRALDIDAGSDRDAELARLCGDDEELRRQVVSLLEDAERPDELLDGPLRGLSPEPESESPTD
jgi:hypothetical protein